MLSRNIDRKCWVEMVNENTKQLNHPHITPTAYSLQCISYNVLSILQCEKCETTNIKL